MNEQTVVITGAAGNLGRAVAHAFARRNARLVLVDRRAARLAEHYGAEHERLCFVEADLTSASATRRVAERALEWSSRIDALCNIAGGFRAGTPVHETPDATFDALFDVNVRSLLNMVRAVVPAMLAQRRGAIVNVAALAGQKGVAGIGAYSAAKAVVVRLTEAMAAELKDAGIRVNCVMPSTLDTPQNRADMPGADASKWVAPADLAETVVYLASDAANAINGAALPVTGRT